MEDLHRRTVWSLSKGRVIDDDIVDDVTDHMLNRFVDAPDNIGVEITMKDVISMYYRIDAGVTEVYSQPRVTKAAAEFEKEGMRPQPR